MNVIVEKIKSDTPKGWKKVRNIAAAIAAIATSMLPFLDALPPKVSLVLKIVIAISGVVAGKAQLQTTDKELNKKQIINLKLKRNVRKRND